MLAAPFKSRALVDYLYDFSKGVNKGIDYSLLPKNQLSSASNTTVRGAFVGPRPYFRKIALVGGGYEGAAALTDLVDGRYHGGCYYKPDAGTESLFAAINGKLLRFEISGAVATVTHEMPALTQDSTAGRHWLWQAERYVIWNDGFNNPVIYPLGRSNYGTTTPIYARNNAAAFTIPTIGGQVTVAFDVLGPSTIADLEVGDVVTHRYRGSFTVQSIAGVNVTLLNVSATPSGYSVPAATDYNFSWTRAGEQLPPGRMGCYGMGRIWMSLTDGKQFVAGDIVGGSSGTAAETFRDAVLNITENLYLSGGGNFQIPGAYGDIRAMVFSETLDSSLGQGALQVYTPHGVFSCNAPVDRSTWQDVTNPILTESAKSGGGLSQWSTVNWNSDILSRDYVGIRSLILSRREFNTWGNVPISREVQAQLDRDSEDLLGYTSSVVFDNRHLQTTESELVEGRGVVWKRLTAINADPMSSLGGKLPSLYDALYWQGLRIFQVLAGDFSNENRCFAFVLGKTDEIELWEILKSASSAIVDDEDTRVVWSIESPMLDFGQRDPRLRERLRLGQSEIGVHDLRGKVSFQAYFRPEFYPCWIPWGAWEECATNTESDTSPSYRSTMGLPEPDPGWCDPSNNRPLREGYFFQVKLVVTGHCKVSSWKFAADTVPQPTISPPVCTAICPT